MYMYYVRSVLLHLTTRYYKELLILKSGKTAEIHPARPGLVIFSTLFVFVHKEILIELLIRISKTKEGYLS